VNVSSEAPGPHKMSAWNPVAGPDACGILLYCMPEILISVKLLSANV